MSSNSTSPDDAPSVNIAASSQAASTLALRQRAESTFRKNPERTLEKLKAMSLEATRLALHELEVHQIELEMQNQELRQTQVKLDAARARYFDLYDLAPVGYVTLSESGLILEANLTVASLLGVTRGALVGQPLSLFIPLVADQNLCYLHFKRVRETGEPQKCELSMVRPDGKQLRVHLASTATQDADGAPVCRVTLSDITEHEALAKQLRRAQRLASIGTLSVGITHDLNNTLQPIVLSVNMLKERISDPCDQELLEVILSSAGRVSSVVRQLLTFARGIEGERVAVQVRHLFKEMSAIIHAIFPRDLVLQIDAAADLWPVKGDPTQLHQVLMNLSLNARDAMPNGGRLMFKANNVELNVDDVRAHPQAKAGPHIAITVSDTGHGVPPDNVECIFDPFFTTKVRGKGTGLGLSTAAGIVRSHAGFITVESTQGRGAAFTVFLPAAETITAAVAMQEEPAPSGRGELILVVDDEPLICMSLRLALESQGYKVVTAGDGAEALAVFKQRHREIRLVLTDVMMPAMEGTRLIRALRDLNPKLRTVAFSGESNPTMRANLEAAGVDSFLEKPCEPREMLQVIVRLLKEAH